MQYGKMLEKRMKQFVYMVFDRREQGFTLLSMLFVMTILLATLPLLAYITKSTIYDSNYDELSIQQFFQFLRDDFISATDYAVSKNKLILIDSADGNRVSFERYNHTILRQVDGTGHDIYLRDVKGVTFTALPYGVHVEITSLEGEHYEKTIVFYMDSKI